MSFEPKILNWNDCEWTIAREKMRFVTYQAENMTTTLTEVIPGHTPGPHSHKYEQLIFILQGECDFYVDGQPHHLTPGCVMTVPGGVEHYIVATGTEPVLNLDVFWPNRPERIESKLAASEEEKTNLRFFGR